MKQFTLTELKNWEKGIIADFPLIYKETDKECKEWYLYKTPEKEFDDANPPEDYCNLRFGFECEEGWAGIIRKFSEAATELVVALRQAKEKDPTAYPAEIFIHSCIFKEKMGALTWQGNSQLPAPFNKLFRSLCYSLKQESLCTCEKTGEYGEPHETTSKWIKVLSEEEGITAGMKPVSPKDWGWSSSRPPLPGYYWAYTPGKKSKIEKNIRVIQVGKAKIDAKTIFGPEVKVPNIEMLKRVINDPKKGKPPRTT